MTPSEQRLLSEIEEFGGMEIHQEHWHIAEALERLGVIKLGPITGMLGTWRRAWLVRPRVSD